ncbi:MAG TPA: hypothetical protein VGE63_00650 [Candidatus Paceibacterota bacterium]
MFAFLLDPLVNSGITKGVFGLLTNNGLIGFASLLTFLGLMAIGYSYIRIKEIKKEEDEKWTNFFVRKYETQQAQPSRWETIRGLFLSDAEEKWRLAIIEADSLIEELLRAKGVPGATFADMLKANPPFLAPVIQQVWGVHIMRNRIAHEGLMFKVDRRLANHAYQVYEAAVNMIQAA